MTLLLLLCACGGRSAGEGRLPEGRSGPPGYAPAGLPGLAELSQRLAPGRGRSASYSPADLVRSGTALEPELPQQNVFAQDEGILSFHTTAADEQDGLAGRAYAGYRFDLGDYSGDPLITLDWGIDQAGISALLLLANWDTRRWDLYPAAGLDQLGLPSLDPYLDDGSRLLLVCMLQSPGLPGLRSVRIGTPPPQPLFSADPQLGRVPFTVSFDAGASNGQGPISEYLWDPEGDGSFVSTGGEPLFQFEYTQPGDYNATLRVIDSSGTYNTAGLLIQARDYSFHSFGNSAAQYGSRVLPGPDGKLLISGATMVGQRFVPLFSVVDPASLNIQSRLQALGGNFEARDAALGPDGAVYACGTLVRQSPADLNAVLQKWRSDGSLEWSREYGNAVDDEAFRAIRCSADALYVAGEVLPDGAALHASVARLSLDGELLWASGLSSPASSVFYGLDYLSPGQPLDAALYACGGFYDGVDQQALYASFDESGTVLDCRVLGDAMVSETAQRIVAAAGPGGPEISLAGNSNAGSALACFVSRLDGSACLIPVAGSDGLNLNQLIRLSTGQLTLSLSSIDLPAVSNSDLLLRLDEGLAISAARQVSYPPGELLYGAGLLELPGGQLALASGSGGLLPEVLSLDLSAEALSPGWSSLTPVSVSFSAIATQNLDTSTAELSGPGLDRQLPTDKDMVFGLLRLD